MTDKEEYPISPMHRHLKKVVWYQLTREPSQVGREDGKVHRLKWLFETQDFPCGACHRIDYLEFMVLPTGVYRSCRNEGFTEKIDPIGSENGQEAILLEDIVCDNDQAIEVVRRYHQEKIYLDEDSRIFLPEYKIPRSAGRRPQKKVVE